VATTNTKKEAPKAGYKTTEFWLSTAAVLAGVAISAGLADPDGAGAWDKVIGVVCSLLAAMGYTISRSNVKTAAEDNK